MRPNIWQSYTPQPKCSITIDARVFTKQFRPRSKPSSPSPALLLPGTSTVRKQDRCLLRHRKAGMQSDFLFFIFACPLLGEPFFSASTALQQRQPHCWLPLSASHYSNIIDINIEKKKTDKENCKEQWLEEERLFIHLRSPGPAGHSTERRFISNLKFCEANSV